MNFSSRSFRAFAAVLFATALGGSSTAQGEVHPTQNPIADRFIVVLSPDAAEQSIGAPRTTAQVASDLAGFYGGQTVRTFDHAIHGFAFQGSSAAAENLSRDARVAYVAQDGLVTLSGGVETPAPWGLDRIDQREETLNAEYIYAGEGTGVDVYVVDTGIRSTHDDFGGRVDMATSFTAIDDGHGAEDCYGHGTVVAGVVGGATYGVAKGVTLHSVRVVGCDGMGSIANSIAGIDWITARQQAPGARRAVVNMSLYNGFSFPLEDAVGAAIAAGVVVVAAAGNDNLDTPCYISPQRMPAVITVGASDGGSARWGASNYGECLDLFAPGEGIASTYMRNDQDTTIMSGTSVAAPMVAGTAALVLAANPAATPAEVQNLIVAGATLDALTDIGEGSPNLLLYTAIALDGSPQAIFGDGFESGDEMGWLPADNRNGE
ncbi:MAG: S8 family serine peptidase [Thermoanaerobaculia bacterium]